MVKGHGVNWDTIYDLLYVFHINFGRHMYDAREYIPLNTQITLILYLKLSKVKGHEF